VSTNGAKHTPKSIRAALNRKALASARHRAIVAERLGLGERELLAVQYVAMAGRMTPAQLGARLRLTSGGVTALVRRLVQAGHLAREPHSHDRRSVVLRLTRETERSAGDVFAPLVRDLDALALALPEDHREVVGAFIAAVADVAEQHAEELAQRTDAASPEALGVPAPGLWA